jgi:hypothetical protein
LVSLLVTVVLFLARRAQPDFPVSYLWDNLIGCAACVVISHVIQSFLPRMARIGADKNVEQNP